MRISIDPDRCVGHGLCYVAAPGLVDDDERGFGRVAGDGDLPSEAYADARAARLACPEGAVVLDGEAS